MAASDSQLAKSTVASNLQARFNALQLSLGAKSDVAEKWSSELVARYTEQQRYYHTVSHVAAMLDCLDTHVVGMTDPLAVELAVYFHDWIYEPQSKTNEADSVEAFVAFAKELALDDLLSEKVVKMIEATVTHQIRDDFSPSEINDVNLFLDFDLEVLGRNWDDYLTYAGQIRKEYISFEEHEYNTGRAQVLKNFLERDRIYFSEVFYEEKETSARRNVNREINKVLGN
jgi:predicted metal-dependent HD superfamily phosphohydrolase